MLFQKLPQPVMSCRRCKLGQCCVRYPTLAMLRRGELPQLSSKDRAACTVLRSSWDGSVAKYWTAMWCDKPSKRDTDWFFSYAHLSKLPDIQFVHKGTDRTVGIQTGWTRGVNLPSLLCNQVIRPVFIMLAALTNTVFFCKLPTAVASACLHTSGGQLLVQPGIQNSRAGGGLLCCGVAAKKNWISNHQETNVPQSVKLTNLQ